jgi:hypothetical protein
MNKKTQVMQGYTLLLHGAFALGLPSIFGKLSSFFSVLIKWFVFLGFLFV